MIRSTLNAMAWLALATVACATAVAQPLADSLEERRSQAKLKAAYLFNIARFVTWPDSPSEVSLCIHNKSAVLSLAGALQGRALGGGRSLAVRAARDIHDCHIFLAPDGWEMTEHDGVSPATLKRTLVIGDTGASAPVDAALQLYVDAGKLRFFVVDNELRQAEFQISSKLMRLARIRGGQG